MTTQTRPRRFLRRRGLITLALNSRESEHPPAGFAPDPEITETDIWLHGLPPAYDDLRIVHLTDIHHSLFTPLEDVQRAVHLANLLRPDLVALTGDYVTLSPSFIWPVARALGKLKARLGVFAVLGNHDFQVDADEITRALRAQRIRVLRNAHFALRSRSNILWIAGVDDLWWGADDLASALRSVPPRDPKILLCHNPTGIREAADHGVDLVLSGHTHGGQVRLPVVGSVYGRSKLGERFVEGWNRLNGTQIYVSRGIGKVLLPVRFGCPPEIACLRLRRSGPAAAGRHPST
jgi:predicted MPP superfamily phosphohydrolase